MIVDLDLYTGAKGRKKRKPISELEEYYESIREDSQNDNPTYHEIFRKDPWQWWVKYGQHRYPTLFEMAIDLLSIPATSCECERCFSSAKRSITADRNSLLPSTIEALQLQKNWLRHQVVDSPLQQLAKHVGMADKDALASGGDDTGAGDSPSPSLVQVD